MEYALQLLIPIALGLGAGIWMHNHWGASPIWTVVLMVVGMFAGIGILYKNSMMRQKK